MTHVPHAFLERNFWLLPSLPLGTSTDPSPAVGGMPFPQGPTHVTQGGLTPMHDLFPPSL